VRKRKRKRKSQRALTVCADSDINSSLDTKTAQSATSVNCYLVETPSRAFKVDLHLSFIVTVGHRGRVSVLYAAADGSLTVAEESAFCCSGMTARRTETA
jgi:hypothetical protein